MDGLTREMYEKIQDEWLLRDLDTRLPCYCTRFTVTGDFDSENKIKAYILAAREWSDRQEEGCHLNMFSVTAEDKYPQLWLKVAKEMSIVVVNTPSCHKGNYSCWMILDQFD